MSIKMKKSDLLIAFTIIALAISGLSMGLFSCQEMEGSYYEEEEVVVVQRPVASIVNSAGIEVQADDLSGDYQFILKWENSTGALDSPENIEVIKDVYDKWIEYEEFLDARPFFPPLEEGNLKRYGVWVEVGEGNKVLNNNEIDGKLIIQRYWDSEWGHLTTTNWTAHRDEREEAFLDAAKQIEAMRTALAASPFWEVSYEKDDTPTLPLQELSEEMLRFISTGDIPEVELYTERGPWLEADKTAPTRLPAGPLYELYFGHIPGKDEYIDPDGDLVYPDE
jgi:hypothetical protein